MLLFLISALLAKCWRQQVIEWLSRGLQNASEHAWARIFNAGSRQQVWTVSVQFKEYSHGWSCLVPLSALFFFCQSFQSKMPTQRNHPLSVSERSTERLCWLPANSNTCVSVTRLGDLPKVVARNACAIYNAGIGRKISDTRPTPLGWQENLWQNCL